jgi:predicted phage terminase large subunit-like protein
MDFPALKRAVTELAAIHRANIVLVEDKASGTSLIAELRSQNFSAVQEAPSIDGDKVMRLRGQTAKIAGGFVLFPKKAHWLDTYLLELVTFPNSKNDDQVDSTVYALAWSTLHSAVPYNTIKMRSPALSQIRTRMFELRRCRMVPTGSHLPAEWCKFRQTALLR